MSYGTGSGAPLFSDLTIAFLEDTNQYIVNHSASLSDTNGAAIPFCHSHDIYAGFAGPLLAAAPADYVPDLISRVDSSVTAVRQAPWPGNLSWGRGLGCAFVMSSALHWPAEYTCSQAGREVMQ